MSQKTPRLSLPYIQAAQAQKHLTHNDAIRALDLLVQLSFEDDTLTAPPPAPDDGACYIAASGATGAWSGQDGNIAVYLDGVWQFSEPHAGWRGIVLSRNAFVIHDGTDWTALSVTTLQNAGLLGLGMSADHATPFAAKINAALWTALYSGDGGTGDMMHTLNKEAASHDAGWVLQDDFQTRALMGLFGSNQLRLSVSPDGATFHDGIVIDPDTGIAHQPALPRFKAALNYDAYVAEATWTKVPVNQAEYNAQAVFDAATNLFTAPVDGTYMLGCTLKYLEDTASGLMQSRLLVNAVDEVSGSNGRISGTPDSGETALWMQTLAVLTAGDTVELQTYGTKSFYAKADETVFWGYKIG